MPHGQVVFVGVLGVPFRQFLDLEGIVYFSLYLHFLLFTGYSTRVSPRFRNFPKLPLKKYYLYVLAFRGSHQKPTVFVIV